MTPTLLNNRYQVIQTLGAGGFGTTFLAEDTQIPSRRKCVVKQLKPIANNPEVYQIVQERFRREAAILEELGDANDQIPRLYAYFAETGEFYLIQEWIEGVTLQHKAQAEGAQSESLVRQILTNILPVLTYVHDKRIVHRDIKPDNIILRKRDNRPVLIDFGAVRETMGTVVNSQGGSVSSIVIGTPGFMPSEQAAGRPMYSSDLYSLGLTMIYLLTGKLPQELDLDPHTGDITWRRFAPNVSSGFADLLDKAIQYHPRDRYTTAQEMLAALHSTSDRPSEAPNYIDATYTPPSTPSRDASTPATAVPGEVPNTIINSPTPPNAQPSTQIDARPVVGEYASFQSTGSTPVEMSEVPREVPGWNWGAFLLPGLWCLSNQVWGGLAAWSGLFTGTLGWWVVGGILGAKGNEWAWKSRRWRSVETFKANQRAWSTAGLLIWGGFISLFGVLVVIAIVNPEAFEDDTIPTPLSSGGIFSMPDGQGDSPTTTLFGQTDTLVEPAAYIDGTWRLSHTTGTTTYKSTLTMTGTTGTLTTQSTDSSTGVTESVSQTMQLWASPRGFVVLGYDPVDSTTQSPKANYSADNFLFQQQPDGSMKVTSCNDAGTCSDATAELVGATP